MNIFLTLSVIAIVASKFRFSLYANNLLHFYGMQNHSDIAVYFSIGTDEIIYS